MPFVDSVDKIVTSYFAAVTTESFTYKKREYSPKLLAVSPGIFRGYTCPAKCGGCCFRFSLDYIDGEVMPPGVTARAIEFSGRTVPVWTDTQNDREGEHFCRHLKMDDGRCGIHKKHPFSCDFELIRFLEDEQQFRVTTRLFGRGWRFTRIDGTLGAMCDIVPPTPEWKSEAIRKMTRLQTWATHFGISTCLTDVIGWLETGPHEAPGFFNTEFQREAIPGFGWS